MPTAAELRERYRSFPDELKSLPRFVCYRLEPDAKKPERFKKIPYDPLTGRRAKANDSSTWGTFDQALAAAEKRNYDGVGFQFGDDGPYVGIDIDHCVVDGKLSDFAASVVARLDSYTELSPSGTGVHIFVKAKLPPKGNRVTGENAIEMYGNGRFFTITGRALFGTLATIEERQREIDALHGETFGEPELPPVLNEEDPGPEFSESQSEEAEPSAEFSIDGRLKKIRASKSGPAFEKLYDDGDLSAHGGDHSAADFALLCLLAFWFGKNPTLMEQVFTDGKLGQREKWRERADYREESIANAIKATAKVYEPSKHLPGGFVTRGKRIFKIVPPKKEGGAPISVPVASEMSVIGRARDKDNLNWQYVVEAETPEGGKAVVSLPKDAFVNGGADWQKRLLNAGADIDDAKFLAEYIQDGGRRSTTFIRLVKRVGWVDDGAFVLPDMTYGEKNQRYILDSSLKSGHRFNFCGTHEEWKTNIGARCRGNSRLILGVCVAALGPLLPLASAASPGFHFVGETSLGKSTALHVAGSFCGGSVDGQGYASNWRATSNGLELEAATHNNLLLALDEMKQADPRSVGETAYMLGNGSGKKRMNRSLGAAETMTWQLSWLGTGEVSLEEIANEGGRKIKGGERVRCLDIPADAGAGMGMFEDVHGFESPQAFADCMKDAATKKYYGTPLRALLEALVARRAEIQREYQGRVKVLEADLSKLGKGGEFVRAASYFALAGAAGEIATKLGVTGFEPGDCDRAATVCFNAWIARRGTNESSDDLAMVRQVRLFLEQHGDSRFDNHTVVYDDLAKRPRVINRAGILQRSKKECEPPEFLIFVESWKEICAGFSHERVAAVLAERGFLATEGDRNQARRTIEGKQNRYYVVSSRIVEGLESPSNSDAPY